MVSSSASAAAGVGALRQAKVEHLDPCRRDHHVAGFQIAMDDAARVRGRQGVGDLVPSRRASSTDRAPLASTLARFSPWTNSMTR